MLPHLFTSVFSPCQLGGCFIDYLGHFTLRLLVGSFYLYNNYSIKCVELSINFENIPKIIIYKYYMIFLIYDTHICKMSPSLYQTGGQKVSQYKSFVQKGIGVKYRRPGSGIPFKS